jgi:hypothetical protein
MKPTCLIHVAILAAIIAGNIYALPIAHKSEAEISRMTPEQRVHEYCDEYHRHSLWDSDYIDLLSQYIRRDGVKSLPAIVQIMDEFDPTNSKGKSNKKKDRASAAGTLLSEIDGRLIRLRAFPEGRAAIEALRREVQRMLAAHFDTADVMSGEGSDRYRYEICVSSLEDMEGLNLFDMALQDTLRIRHKQNLSKKEMLAFVEYLISQEPKYPSWCPRPLEHFRDFSDLNEAGYPRQYHLIKNMEPFYNAYLKYKSSIDQ